ncbi:DUF6087 family protein [Kitasatospora sp. NPDC089797]|uniref:DUF6087 family protein n=1 Tax=Kitasatospora sp. NPDC089797 TaxID=3155298 RepID=UPI00342858E7
MFGPDDESVAAWYTDRAGLAPPAGTRDALALDPDAERDGLFRDFGRLVVEWDGAVRQPVAVTESYADAYALIVEGGAPVFPQADTPVPLLRRGTGRHRK